MGAAVEERKIFGLAMWQQVLLAMVLGIAAGFLFGEEIAWAKNFGVLFLNAIKMVVVPLIFLALVSGITSIDDMGSVARVASKGVGAYLSTAVFAVCIGLVFGNVYNPGEGFKIDPAMLGDVPATGGHGAPPPQTVGGMLMSLIPTNAFRAMVEDQFLQVVIFALFTGFTINLLKAEIPDARRVIKDFTKIVFKMIGMIVQLAPLAVFGFMAWMVGTLGIDSLKAMAKLVEAVVTACLFQYCLFGVLIFVVTRLNPITFYKKAMTTQLMAFSTSSSKATLTTAMGELENKLGVSPKTCNFLMPLGASMNMDGTAIYLAICAIFFAEIYGIHLGLTQYLVLILTCTLGSIGAAGIPSGSIIFMAMVLHSVGIPIEGIGILLGIDRLLDMLRTTVNITGDMAITLIIDDTEKTLDRVQYNSSVAK